MPIYPQPKPKRHKYKGVSLEKECMNLWREIVFIRAGRHCEYCGTSDQLQGHHVFTRSKGRLKYDPDNGCCLCSGHHLYFAHKKPHSFRDWLTEKRGQTWWVKLSQLSNVFGGKIDMKMTKIWLLNERENAAKTNMSIYA